MDKQWALGLVAGVVMTSLIAIGISKMKTQHEVVASVDMPRDIIQAYNMGLKDALKTNPVSLELDQTCLNLWANKQPPEMK
jgi:hypothetical protein